MSVAQRDSDSCSLRMPYGQECMGDGGGETVETKLICRGYLYLGVRTDDYVFDKRTRSVGYSILVYLECMK